MVQPICIAALLPRKLKPRVTRVCTQMSATGSPSTSTPAATQVALTAEPHSTELSVKCVAPEYSIALILSNGTSLHHCFKLKTNAPRRWSVRPNGGVLAPGETAALSIKVIRTSADFRGIEDDRHLIVSVPVSPAEAVALREQRAAEGDHGQ